MIALRNGMGSESRSGKTQGGVGPGDGSSTLETMSETLPVSQRRLSSIRSEPRDQSAPRAALVVYHRDGVETRPLLEGVSLTLGRGGTADVHIKDPSLSRHHARIELIDGRVYIEDLGSTNGTAVDGTLIRRSEVNAGQRLTIGVVDMTLIRLAPAEAIQWGLDDHDRFLRELEIEVSRSEVLGHQAALAMIRASQDGFAPLGEWFSRLRESLRPFDRIAMYSADTVEVLFVESGEERAREFFKHFEPQGGLYCGLALFPVNARSADGLVQAARSALLKASTARPFQLADPRENLLALASGDKNGPSPIMASAVTRELFEMAERVANSALPTLLVGETGSGKEVVAQWLHARGPRRARPIVSLNCGAMAAHLAEAQLFGQERGAFPGADHRRLGIFERAHGGTLFLDEVGALPASAQAALLRVLETGRIIPLGAATELSIDVRIIAATNRDLDQLCREGKFGQDLLFRLNALTLEVPPLRDRTEDIIPLAESFLTIAAQSAGRKVPNISRSALQLLLSYPWPGNVRELRNTIERAVVIAKGDTIAVEDLPERVRALSRSGGPVVSGIKNQSDSEAVEIGTLKEQMERYEATLILRALDRSGSNREAAADALGLPLRTLAHKMKSHGIRKGRKGRYEQS